MQKFNLVFVFLIANFCFSQENSMKKDTVFYTYTGLIASKGELKNGVPNGVWISYFENGKKKSIASWENGKLDGKTQFFSSDGLLNKSIEYQNNLKNGYSSFYDSLANIKRKVNYENDTLNGKGFTYYPSGEIESEFMYIKGKLQGTLTQYAEDDHRIILVEKYDKDSVTQSDPVNLYDKNGLKKGYWKDYENGKLVGEGEYLNGKKNGYYRKYDRFNNLSSIDSYLFDRLVPGESLKSLLEIRKVYYPNGKVRESGGYKNNYKIGVFSHYDSLGNYLYSSVYKKDTLLAEGTVLPTGMYDSSWVFYYPTGEKKSDGEYENGAKNGKWSFYYEDGKKAQTGIYKKDLVDGIWTWYYKNKQIRRTEYYYKGKLNGEVLEYDSLGNELTKGNYQNDKQEGAWFYHVGDHKEVGQFSYGKRTGLWIYYFENGKIAFKGEFKDGEPDGRHKTYYENGILDETGKYTRGNKIKTWKKYSSKGELLHTFFYKSGKLVSVDSQPMK